MSSASMKWARRQVLPGRLKRLVDLLAVIANDHNLVTHSQEEMALRLGVVSRTVARSLADLEALGVIRRAMRRDARGGRAADCIELCADTDFALDQPDKMSSPSKNDNQKVRVSQGGNNPSNFASNEAATRGVVLSGPSTWTIRSVDEGDLSSWPAPDLGHALDRDDHPKHPLKKGDHRA